MEITGKLIKVLPTQSGQSERGEWQRNGFVIETEGEYPRKVAFMAFGDDRVRTVQSLVPGSTVKVNFQPNSREYQDRWYTELKVTKVEVLGGAAMPVQPAAPVMPSDNDGLPF
jgi:hypothetical protein